VALVLLSGIRRGELFALRWRTVNDRAAAWCCVRCR